MGKTLTLQTKFNEGDSVWVFRGEDCKFYEGTIKEIQSWDKWSGFRYQIQHHGESDLDINAEEKFIFATKDEILANNFVAEA